jgi:subtilisin family serine protease
MNTRSLIPALLAVVALAACSDASSPVASAAVEVVDVPRAAASASTASIPNEYIVTFSDAELDPEGRANALVAGMRGKGRLKHVYKHGLKGFAATMSSEDAEALSDVPGVERVEEDVRVSISTTETPKSWGLDRLDQRSLPLSGSFTYTSTGSGVRVYIVDTGILPSHQEFGGRVIDGYSSITDGMGWTDCHGHGTHVAGTAAGATTGIARSASLVAVRVLDCVGYGTSSGVIAGIDWVIAQKNAAPSVPMVANMSLGGDRSLSLDDAVERAIIAGVTFAVAAGNSNIDACTQSPAAAVSAITVGATASDDSRAYYSNYGSCLDIFAPGSDIYSAYSTATNAYAMMSGTSMASPHVAGIAAVILGDAPSSSPAQVRSTMIGAATASVVTSAGSLSPNFLLTNLFAAVAPPPPTTTPTPISNLTVSRVRSGSRTNMNLSWNPGTTGGSVSVYRNNSVRATTTNDGSYTDSKVSGTVTYKVCQGTTCTNSVTISSF